MNIKYGTITKKINDVVNIIYPKSSSNMIDHNNTTVKTALEDIANDLLTLSSQTSTIDSRISTACNNLYNRIVGTVDNYTINEVYDTLTEISQYLEEHEDVVSGFINDIGDLQDQDTAIKNVLGSNQIIENYSGEKLISRVSTIEDNVSDIDERTSNNSEQINLIKNEYEYDYKFYSNYYTWNVGKYAKVIDNTLTFINEPTAAYLVIDAKKTNHYLIKGVSAINIPLVVLEEIDGNNSSTFEQFGFGDVGSANNIAISSFTEGDIMSTILPVDNFEGKIYINAIYATKAAENITMDITVIDNNENPGTHTITCPVPYGTPVIGIAKNIKRSNTCFVTFIGDQYCYGENWCVSHYKPDKLNKNNLREESLNYYGIDDNNNKVELSENNWEIEAIGESILNCIPDPFEGRLLGAIGGSEWQNNEEIMSQYPGITTHGSAFGIPLAFAESNRNAYILTTYEHLCVDIYNNTEDNMLDYDLKYTIYKSSNDSINNYYILSFMFDEFINGNDLGDPNNIDWLPKEYNDLASIENKYQNSETYVGSEQTEHISSDNYINRLQITITKILHDIPGVKIGFITPLKLYNEDYVDIKNRNNESLETWVNAAKTVCNYFNIPVLDLYHDGPHAFYQAKYENYYTDSTFKDSNNKYVCYPNSSTYRLMNNKIEKFIYSL